MMIQGWKRHAAVAAAALALVQAPGAQAKTDRAASAAAHAEAASPASGATLAGRSSGRLPGGRYGDVTVVRPDGEVRGFVVLYSAAGGWRAADQATAEALAKAGALTVGVDTARYAANLAKTKESCHELVGDAEAVSHQLERQLKTPRYFAPIVAGIGQGGTLARQVLAQAPENTISGAVAVAPAARLDPRFKMCPPDPTVSRRKIPGFVDTAASGDVERLVTLLAPHLRDGSADQLDVSDLPLVELPAAPGGAAAGSGLLAIVISGDGGWRDLDKTIAEALQKDGVAVIGWDSLRYFWSEKTPAQTSHDLARVMQTYMARWHASHVALIGYSFGADVMPFAYNRLPPSLKDKVAVISLLGFAPAADFQIRVTGWLGMPASDKALQVRPEFDKLPLARVQCFYGATEEDTLCPALAKTGAEVIKTGGDHHFGGDYIALERRILDALRRNAAQH
ncbi:virulence factor family protein [Burkholderia glumae]|uniref:AcvB/VirJ family lysyl-phosphatidylglycerol hydrolase n=1 Tax=Burkholderia glumae TaxID=337 RepID=UPI001295E30B|nr:AcvB/VirJ family lysyl-phosphatidylglycerol hydrolase [Burkholderia glumae]QGA37656.1 virulence factor family protein [Burkholderia glumae]